MTLPRPDTRSGAASSGTTGQPSVGIAAWGCDTPSLVLDNAALIARLGLDATPEWIESRTGIRTRHWLPEGETTSDMAVRAAARILERAGVRARELDRILLATITPDHPSPSTATIVARKLGARCPAFDISAACAGFLYGLELGAASVRGGERRVLVLAADARSRFVDPQDRRSACLFADGCGGVLLAPTERPGLLAVVLGAEGRERMGAYVPAGGAAKPASHATVEAREHYVRVDGREEIFDLFVRFNREACLAALDRAGVSLGDVDLFITHQGNANMVKLAADDLGFPADKVVNEVARHGNTVGATVPIALAEALERGRLRPGQVVLLSAVGAGYTFGAAVVRI